MLKLRSKLFLLALLTACLVQGVTPLANPLVRRIGEGLRCMCGSCQYTVTSCNMMECHGAKEGRDLLLQMVVSMFYTLGGMLVFLGALFDSFKVWPLLSPLPSLAGMSDLVFLHEIDRMMGTVMKFAAPVLLVLLLVDLGFGLITRAADKLEPSGLSQPVKGAVTLLLLALLAGVFILQVRHFLLPTHLIEQLQAWLPAR